MTYALGFVAGLLSRLATWVCLLVQGDFRVREALQNFARPHCFAKIGLDRKQALLQSHLLIKGGTVFYAGFFCSLQTRILSRMRKKKAHLLLGQLAMN